MSRTYICSDPMHDGNPARVHPADRLELRYEWRRLSDQGREHVRKVSNVCKPCMRRSEGVRPEYIAQGLWA